MKTKNTLDHLMIFGDYVISGIIIGQIYTQNLDYFTGMLILTLSLTIGFRNHYSLIDDKQ